VARNRKRAKDRRTRRPTPPASSRRGLATQDGLPGLEPADNGVLPPDENGTPNPIDHATPDVELADAQLAFGRPAEPEPGDEADEEEFEREVDESIEDGAGRDVAATGPVPAERRAGMFARLIGFLQGCWRELQRVQWPDRRQVMQATGVVIGFVIIAAAFLGLADLVAGKIVTFILK
jgi:preprotein translocase subunit SecE